jgi:hypothetical protein
MAPCVVIEQIPAARQLQAWKASACGHTLSLDHEGAIKIYAHQATEGHGSLAASETVAEESRTSGETNAVTGQ